MVSKLCCTAEQDRGRPESPHLPNARLRPATPANRPLLLQHIGSPQSGFTSTQSEDLLEIRDIFDHAQDHLEHRPFLEQAPRTRLSRASSHSLRSLHKMASMRSIIQRKFSKEYSKKDLACSSKHSKTKPSASKLEHSFLPKKTHKVNNEQFSNVKADLRNHLLSDKKASKGGYDSDAEVIDDMAKNFGKKIMGKRPSIHSIDWATSVSSKPTSGSSIKTRNRPDAQPDIQPYQIQGRRISPFLLHVNHVLSAPDLRTDTCNKRNGKIRRSYSAASVVVPQSSQNDPLRLPSLTNLSSKGLNWPEVIDEIWNDLSLQTLAPHPTVPGTSSFPIYDSQSDDFQNPSRESATSMLARPDRISVTAVGIKETIPPTTSVSAAKFLCRAQNCLSEHPLSTEETAVEDHVVDEDGQKSLRSVHLDSMRISHHLRSGSLLSWSYVVDVPDASKTSCLSRQNASSEQNQSPCRQRKLARHQRNTSSSGFTSSKVPSRWGRVLPNESDLRADFASSVYSSRSQSPIGNMCGSKMDFSQATTSEPSHDISSMNGRKSLTTVRVASKPMKWYTITDDTNKQIVSADDMQNIGLPSLARKNSVADTKRSKFREEFGSSPPKSKSTSSNSIIKYLGLKRLSMRSQSETNLHSNSAGIPVATDGQFDQSPRPSNRSRHQSRSLMSLQTEQEALAKTKGADYVWERALKAHQEEKASFFLPENKGLAVQGSPFRERSGSIASKTLGTESQNNFERPPYGVSTVNVSSKPTPFAFSLSRRDALPSDQILASGDSIPSAFDKQGDGPNVVGAWGRYPSHSRRERTSTTSQSDCVDARDFALEAAIKFASNKPNRNNDDDLIDPGECSAAAVNLAVGKRRKRKIGSGRMATSRSMTFGKTFLKNYSKIFKSQSIEFRKHGQGHRTSIAYGGLLGFPELELLPDVWIDSVVGEDTAEHSRPRASLEREHEATGRETRGREEDSMATLRPRRASSVPNLDGIGFQDGTEEMDVAQHGARAWSIYYEQCVKSFPDIDFDGDVGSGDLHRRARPLVNGTRMFPQPHPTEHLRNVSQLSRVSQASQSAPSSWASVYEPDNAEEKSLASVRRSTIDLISKFREQEAAEHERVVALSRVEP